MKKQNNLLITLTIICCFLSLNSNAQNQSKSSQHYFWVGFDSGISSIHINGKDMLSDYYSGHLNYNIGFHLFSFEIGSATFSKQTSSGPSFLNTLDNLIFGSALPPSRSEYTESTFTQANLMYGLITSGSTIRLAFSTGLSFISANDYTTDFTYRRDNDFQGLGVPIKLGTFLSLGKVGLGINYFTNINSYSRSSGLSVSLMIGLMK